MIFWLSDDVDNVLEDNLIIVNILFCSERVNKVIEEIDETEEGLPADTQIDIFW